jgi:hypothetical protein
MTGYAFVAAIGELLLECQFVDFGGIDGDGSCIGGEYLVIYYRRMRRS